MNSKLKVIIIIICNIKITSSNMTGNLINGVPSEIIDFPHSAYLAIECTSSRGEGYFSCGSSIVNEAVLLTAGHCIIGCHNNVDAFAIFGHEQRDKGMVANVSHIKLHEDHFEGSLSNDIALVLLKKNLKFSCTVRRVALMRHPPNVDDATVAGWGKIDELSNDVSNILMSTQQKILLPSTCLFTMNNPAGTFCADSKPGTGFPARADSGNAMVINDFIQIGLVSYMDPHISKRTTVYTNISYFYGWIKYNVRKLFCTGRNSKLREKRSMAKAEN
ncbi:chymotrypsin-1-like [Cydia pomonella]|uniref:chymotrypsin-1-like n=1 Tax=Cydia pomonella TaxID=82600 RepID=UPI002ADDB133|nr:chymotrypsin-1-like [Cydia pomonella]